MFFLCSSDEESSQVFIPFVSDVRVGSESHPNPPSMDLDDTIGSPTPEGIKLTPPSSPHVGGGGSVSSTVAHILETTPVSKERYFTVFENPRKSLIQYFELPLHFEWTKFN